jgi:hypothetical protein
MLTKQEDKQLRIEFWNEFEKYSSRMKRKRNLKGKWIMNETGIRQMKLKFDLTANVASVGIDVQTRNLDKRIDLFGKLERLKSIFEKKLGQSLFWELEHTLPTGISISRVCLKLEGVSMYNKEDWPGIFDFFYRNMTVIEELFVEYRDYLKYEALSD